MKPQQALSLVQMLAGTFAPYQWTDERAGLMASAIVDIDYDDAVDAVAGLMRTGTKMPLPAEIRLAVMGDSVSGTDAWIEVCGMVRRVGHLGSPSWSDPLIGRVVAGLGGWENLCMSTNAAADRAHFLLMWKELYERRTAKALQLNALGAGPERKELGR